jgi:hypothetical protein
MSANRHAQTARKPDRRDRTRKETQVRISRQDRAILSQCMAMPNTMGVPTDGVSRYLAALIRRELAILRTLPGNGCPSNPSPRPTTRQPFLPRPIARERA